MNNPLNAYIACSRLVFSVEPSEPSEDWDDFEEFEEKITEFYGSITCKSCKLLLIDPCTPKKQHLSCQHARCLDCIGKNPMTSMNCKMCRDYTLFEKSNQISLVLKLFKELCVLIKGSWIYDYIQRKRKPDTGQSEKLSLTEIIENGINYGQLPIVVEDSSSSSSESSSAASSGDENSNSSLVKEPLTESVPYINHSAVLTSFPSISPLAPMSPKIVQSDPEPQPISVLPIEQPPPPPPLLQTIPTSANLISAPSPSGPQLISQIITQYPIIQSSTPIITNAVQQTPQIVPSTSKITPNQPLLKSPSSFIAQQQQQQQNTMRVKTPIHSTMHAKSIMSPIKIQQQTAPTIYSVMYTGSGNKITLKRKTPSDEQQQMTSIANNESTTFTSNATSSNVSIN